MVALMLAISAGRGGSRRSTVSHPDVRHPGGVG